MSATSATKIYILDTNVLIDLSLWLPIALNKVFWDHLAASLQNGGWVLLDVVVNEIKHNDELTKWCKEQGRRGLIKSISDDNKDRAVAINNAYKMIDDVTNNSTVDTYLVAYAEGNNLAIFSRESQRKKDTDLYKIPDVCSLLKITCIRRPEHFLRAIGFKN